MVRKIHGKMPSLTVKHLSCNNTLITDLKDITDTLAKTFATNSSPNNCTLEFQRYKAGRELVPINFKSKNLEYYNVDFSMRELTNAIHQSRDTAVGPDEIHYQMLRHLPEDSLRLLLNIFNYVWERAPFHPCGKRLLLFPFRNLVKTMQAQTGIPPSL